MSTRRLLLLFGSVTCAAGGLAFVATQPGCSPAQCTQSALTPNEPTPALECAAGLLCYQGQCIKACSAGQEGAIECGSSGDCDAARPKCVEGFCSACDELENCVPTLNICQPISQVELPEPPCEDGRPSNCPMMPKPPAPLDAGYIDGGIKLAVDASMEVPVDQVVTHAGLIDVAQLEDYTGGGAPDLKSRVVIRVLGVGDIDTPGLKWRVDPWNDVTGAPADAEPAATETIVQESDQCEMSFLEAYTSSGAIAIEPANIGDILIDSHADFPSSVATIAVPWDGMIGDYVVPGGLPVPIISFSRLDTGEPHFITASSSGNDPAAGSWPNPEPSNGHHVPFALVPTTDTATQLSGVINVAAMNPNDVVLRWDTIRVGTVPGERVVVRFRGSRYSVRCEQVEDQGGRDDITIKASLLGAFRTQEGLAPNTTLPLYFERASEERLSVPPIEPSVIDVSVRVRHTLIGRIRFF